MRLRAICLSTLVLGAGSAVAAGADWAPFTSKEFTFSASFPAAPKSETSTVTAHIDGKDIPVAMHQFVAKGANGALCLVVHSPYTWPIAVEAELVADRDNFVKGVNATVTASERTSIKRGNGSALPALHFDATGPTYKFRSLVVIDGQTVYQIAGGVPKTGGDEADLDRCVNSFVLTSDS
jgi:hypothetical protein